MKAKVIALCGSTKFKDKFLEVEKKLTLEGNIVLGLSFYSHSDGIQLYQEQISLLKELHKQKIEMSDEMFVINVDNYIGDSTKEEIEYAKKLGKEIRYLINTPETINSSCKTCAFNCINQFVDIHTLCMKGLCVLCNNYNHECEKYHPDTPVTNLIKNNNIRISYDELYDLLEFFNLEEDEFINISEYEVSQMIYILDIKRKMEEKYNGKS